VKLFIDQNLSSSLVQSLSDLHPDSVHVRDAGLAEADDESVWEFAKTHGYCIISKDGDFHQRSFLYGHPPKFIWLRLGNCSTRDIEQLLRERHGYIKRFIQDEEKSFLPLD